MLYTPGGAERAVLIPIREIDTEPYLALDERDIEGV